MAIRVAVGLLLLLVLAAAVFLAGPRVPVDTTLSFDPAAIGSDPEAYLQAAEDQVAGIRDGLRKEIVWAYPQSRAKTPLAIVYLHGFSASKGEVRPLMDRVAASLGANLFYARLTGHGQDGPAMATATVNAWLNDAAEALAIGRSIGERVVLVGTSTGGSLAVYAVSRPELSEAVAALVLISPNFALQAGGAGLLTGPWGGLIAELVVGKERGFEPATPLQARLWTTRYPTRAILPMAAMVDLARSVRVEEVGVPALFVYSEADKVVDPAATKEIAARWGGPVRQLIVSRTDDPSSHVIAGDAFSPSTTASLAADIVAWLSGIGFAPKPD
jgi:pimeloyl-ACP methyl ester carboxylesterase